MNQTNLTFRRATPDDLEFISHCNYMASIPNPWTISQSFAQTYIGTISTS